MNQKIVTFGEVMLRLSAPGHGKIIQTDVFNATYGGGEANVAVSLAQMGLQAALVSRLPENELGRSAANMLRRYEVDTRHIIYGGERIGIYFLEKGAGARASNIIYDRNFSSFSAIEPAMIDWDKIFEDASWFHWTGITPGISKGAAQACKEAIEVAHRKGIFVSADINSRKNMWNYGRNMQEVMPELIAGCDLIIAGRNDAQEILNIEVKGKHEEEIYRDIMGQFPKIKVIASTQRTSVSASYNKLKGFLADKNQFFTSRDYEISPIVDRIGGGDAFMAGLIYGMMKIRDNEKALEFAVAASVLKHSIEGDANLVCVNDIEKLMKGDGSGRLIR